MTVQQSIEALLNEELKPIHLEVINESDGHNVPRGSESHFKVIVVAELFASMPKVKRHQTIYGHLQRFLDSGVHALALHTYSPEEWAKKTGAPESPACLGAKKS